MSTTLQRLEADDATVGGFRITFPSQHALNVSWRNEAPIYPTLDAAKEYTSKVLQSLLDTGRNDDAERTNWPSVTAAVQRIISDWNELTSARIHKAAGH